LPKKVVVIGPESTGKTTLSQSLSSHYQVPWVPEYAREFIDRLGRPYELEDLTRIARGQLEREDRGLREAGELLICDTDLYVLKVWSEHAFNTCDPWILGQIAERKYDLYLLTYIDVPWTDDPQREHPEPAMRAYFYQVYRDIVIQSGTPWKEIRGNQPIRLSQSIESIGKILNLHREGTINPETL